jgi:hypothetical protein
VEEHKIKSQFDSLQSDKSQRDSAKPGGVIRAFLREEAGDGKSMVTLLVSEQLEEGRGGSSSTAPRPPAGQTQLSSGMFLLPPQGEN